MNVEHKDKHRLDWKQQLEPLISQPLPPTHLNPSINKSNKYRDPDCLWYCLSSTDCIIFAEKDEHAHFHKYQNEVDDDRDDVIW